jgi:cob(I)alamin adenosyltransferase
MQTSIDDYLVYVNRISSMFYVFSTSTTSTTSTTTTTTMVGGSEIWYSCVWCWVSIETLA